MSHHANLSRRRFLLGAGSLALGALAGCGEAPQTAMVATSPAASSTTPITPPATPLETASVAGGYPRTVQDKFGAVTINAKPQRIMTFYSFAHLDSLLALGVQPALIATYEGATLLPWQSAAADVPRLLMADGKPNIEKVLAEGIDLIVGATYPASTREVNWGTVLPPIADVPFIMLDYGDFEGQLRIVGAALGMETEAEAKAQEITDSFASFTPSRVPSTIKAFGTYNDGNFIMYKSSSSLSKFLERFGLPALSYPTGVGDQQTDPEAVQAISSEAIPELECDLLLGIGYGEAGLSSIVESPLFQQLQVVKDGRFYECPNDESFAITYASLLSLPTAKDVLTRALARS